MAQTAFGYPTANMDIAIAIQVGEERPPKVLSTLLTVLLAVIHWSRMFNTKKQILHSYSGQYFHVTYNIYNKTKLLAYKIEKRNGECVKETTTRP